MTFLKSCAAALTLAAAAGGAAANGLPFSFALVGDMPYNSTQVPQFDALIDHIGREHARGRRLFVGTANLDAQRMVIWNMGAISASAAPGRYALFRQILLASSAIPAFFPPVMIQAEAGGRTISEMHVDGGTTAQVLTLPDAAIVADRVPNTAKPLHIYMVVNNKLNGEFKPDLNSGFCNNP